MAKRKKTDDAKNMVAYTYRDSGQEYIMKRKMIRAIIIAIIACIALVIFIALFIDEKRRVQETYRSQYRTCIGLVIEDIGYYEDTEADYDFKYRRIVADMNSVASFAFLLEDFEKQQKTINELYTVLLKYPEQMKEKLPETKQALEDIKNELDKGYDEAQEIVDSINLKGF